MVFVDEIFKIEKPGARPLSFADGKFLSMCFSFRLTLNLLCNGTLVLFDQWIILEKLLNSRPYKFSSFKGKRIVCSSYVCKMVFQMLIHVLFCLKMRCVCVCLYMCVTAHKCRGYRTLGVLSLHHVGYGDWTQVTQFGSRYFYVLSHL